MSKDDVCTAPGGWPPEKAGRMPEPGPGCPGAGPLIGPLEPGGPLGLTAPGWPMLCPYPGNN